MADATAGQRGALANAVETGASTQRSQSADAAHDACAKSPLQYTARSAMRRAGIATRATGSGAAPGAGAMPPRRGATRTPSRFARAADYFCVVVVELDVVVVPDGDCVVLDADADGAPEADGVAVAELDVVPLALDASAGAGAVVVVVVVDEEAGGVDGTTTVVEDEAGGAEVDEGGVCCWQAPRASSRLAATAV